VQDLLEFVCSCCHLNPSVYFIRFNLPSNNAGSCDGFKIPDKTTVVCIEVRVVATALFWYTTERNSGLSETLEMRTVLGFPHW